MTDSQLLPLEKKLRKKLESAVKDARDVVEEAARAACTQLGVSRAEADEHLSEDDRDLRRRLRIHGRQLGDRRHAQKKTQSIDRLVEEIGYQHWHRMLFARFLAENNLLMYPDPDGPVPVTLSDCDDLAEDEGAKNGWELAARFAAKMLPQIFRIDSPVFALELPPEKQLELEKILAGLPTEVFTASDSLGWVYQFWQAKRKDEVNASEVKIGARELPAVTQLFTEPYMVSFLLDNSLGAWWAARRLTEEDFRTAKSEQELREKAALPGVPLEYLRFVKVEEASSLSPEQKNKESAEKSQDGSSTLGYFDKTAPVAAYSGNLPHLRQDGVSYFVTFRTADSIPQTKLRQWESERAEWQKKNPEPHSEQQKKEYFDKFPARFQHWLDQGHGACLLNKPEHEKTVADALKHFTGQRYELNEFVIVGNHVHAIVSPLGDNELSAILHSWKSYTANIINKAEGQSGAFWQKESFDHMIRSPESAEKFRKYIGAHKVEEASSLLPEQKNDEIEIKSQDGSSTWTPAAGTFDAWPESLAELKTLDPCCGSGHFLVAALLMLTPMRMELEGLSATEAVDRVLSENLHGLEIDQRCVELAAFALALAAWRFPSGDAAGGYRVLPDLNVACCGLSVSVAKEEWKELARGNKQLKIALDWMYDEFKDAPVLGSLLNPAVSGLPTTTRWADISEMVSQALVKEDGEETNSAGVVAQGLARSSLLLGEKYEFILTNVPYLTRQKQNQKLRDHSESFCDSGKNDLATVFIQRCAELCSDSGSSFVVAPQNWLFQALYRPFRKKMLESRHWNFVARLGPGAFEEISGEVVKVALVGLSVIKEESFTLGSNDTSFVGIDVSNLGDVDLKAEGLRELIPVELSQKQQLENPGSRVILSNQAGDLLEKIAHSHWGIGSGDYNRYGRCFWERTIPNDDWIFQQSTVKETKRYGGREHILFWQNGEGDLVNHPGAYMRGVDYWGNVGIHVSQMSELTVTLYTGEAWDNNSAPIIPNCIEDRLPLWCFCESADFNDAVREIDQALKVTTNSLIQIPFDLAHWQRVASEKYPHGLPEPYSDDPTQWIFHGHPGSSTDALQVAVARLLGYRWPAEVEAASSRFANNVDIDEASSLLPNEDKSQDGSSTMELATDARAWVQRSSQLYDSSQNDTADDDGIVCIPAVGTEQPAEDRLLNLLHRAYEDAKAQEQVFRDKLDAADSNDGVTVDLWRRGYKSTSPQPSPQGERENKWLPDSFPAWRDSLLEAVGHTGKTLESWLRDKFFTQHMKLFHHRPFIWHIWDGLKDGFSVLVNYHKLDNKLLETLIYTYLNDWINKQKNSTEDGHEERLAAAKSLKVKLEKILEGESPHDIFVRWKPLSEQPIGWNPDLNDGVRLNIRPWMTVGDVKKKDAGVLRDKPNCKWTKDRGKDVESAPWYHLGPEYDEKVAARINDHHLTLEEKKAAQE